ncbi:hypothetical protein C7T35_17715 [Variovorax sp. WS11]|uniref:DUF1656 domain-containing protein n=1 Tax=Variovorax sp. WS11 TaxID=1105204 RepID=UPI000D0DBAB7|nr:DUF1656 domain-containing protein [Variovorax sp. WS11]NDZ16065.1 DUF1656 domain-containing protein [Variovorax sp. WS11]PSL83258.1 hypothetical protein C7T35_17715 [Variovorax sp. WS11]
MLAEVSLFGIFINAGLVSAFFAVLLLLLLRKGLAHVGAYRLVWHPALVDLALFMLLWGGVAFAADALQVRLFSLLG